MFTNIIQNASEIIRLFLSELSSRRLRSQKIILIVSILSVIGGIIGSLERERRPPIDYQRQIDALNETEQGIKQLIDFIEIQKGKLAESQALVSSLKEEESKLRPMVEAERKIVDAILDAQNMHNRTHVWTERIISFLLGVIASIVGALFVTAISKARQVPNPPRRTLPSSE